MSCRQRNGRGEEAPETLFAETLLFVVPAGLVRILDRDLKLAGISKKDSRYNAGGMVSA